MLARLMRQPSVLLPRLQCMNHQFVWLTVAPVTANLEQIMWAGCAGPPQLLEQQWRQVPVVVELGSPGPLQGRDRCSRWFKLIRTALSHLQAPLPGDTSSMRAHGTACAASTIGPVCLQGPHPFAVHLIHGTNCVCTVAGCESAASS